MLHRSATTHRGIIHADALRIVPHTQVAGETLVINAVLEGFDFEALRRSAACLPHELPRHALEWAPRLTAAVEAWLRGGRLVLAATAEPLRHAFVVELEAERDVVRRVICAGRPHGS